MDINDEFRELEEAKKEIKKLRKELNHEKKVTAILKDATAFLSGPPEVKFRQLTLLQSEGHPLKLCCKLLEASYMKLPRIFKIEKKQVKKSNDVWVSDLTYIQAKYGFCYLVVFMDRFNREIKGWIVSGSKY